MVAKEEKIAATVLAVSTSTVDRHIEEREGIGKERYIAKMVSGAFKLCPSTIVRP